MGGKGAQSFNLVLCNELMVLLYLPATYVHKIFCTLYICVCVCFIVINDKPTRYYVLTITK